MTEAVPQIRIPSEWTAWLSNLSREENGAWIVLGVGVFFISIAVKGLWTGSIWTMTNPAGFDSKLWDSSDTEHHDRDTDAFNFWLARVLATVAGVVALFMSMKMFGIWQRLFN